MPRFGLRTLLILTVMLGFLFWSWPWTQTFQVLQSPPRVKGVRINAEYVVEEWKFTERFTLVASAEFLFLALWVALALDRRRREKVETMK